MRSKDKLCAWCGLVVRKRNIHKCPTIFLHTISEKEVVVRGDNLEVFWNAKIVIIKEHKG